MPAGSDPPSAAVPSAADDRYRTLVDALDAGYCVIELLFDEDGRPQDYRFLEVNAAFARQSGIAHAVGRRMREIAPGHEQHWFDAYGRVALTGEPALLRNWADRLGRWFEAHAFRIGTPALRQVGVVFTDVTARMAMEDETRTNEAQFRSLTQTLPCLAWTATAEGAFDWFNDRTYEYSGLRHGDLEGDGWQQLMHPDDVTLAAARWAHSASTGDDFEFEGRVRRSDGDWRWHLARAVPVRGPGGALQRWVGTSTDIHDQRAARDDLTRLNASLEAEVAERSAQLQQIWTLVPDLLVAASFTGRFLAVNPAWTRVLGLSERELLDRPFWEQIHPESVPDCERAIVAMARGETVRLQVRMRHANGEWRWFDWAAAPTTERFYAIGRDVTEERRQAAELAQAQAALRQAQKMEAVGQLTGGIAHDFNNLLQVLSGNLHLIDRQVAQNERLAQRVTAAREAVRRGAKLAGQLLAFSRRQALDPKPVHIGRFVTGMEDMLRRAIGEAIEIRTVVPADLWNTLIDPTQVENALLNLAINARDAMAGRGRLTIELANAVLDADYVRAQPDVTAGEYVMLAVSDTGSGMSTEVMEQAFEPFFSTKPPGSGSGLGLSMVYGFVKQSGGHVRIYSEVGHGTTFRLYLPRTRADETVDAPTDPGPAQGGSETVLVVEDDAAVRRTVVDMLTDLGYAVLQADGADQAWKLVDSGAAYDLLLTDVVMPGRLKSTELVARARLRRPQAAVLYTSGYAENAIVHDGRLDPGVDLLPKPYGRETLARKLREVLDRRRPSPPA